MTMPNYSTKEFTKTLDNLECLAAISLARAHKSLQNLNKDYYEKFKEWSKSNSAECYEFILDCESGKVGVQSSHIFWD